MALRKCPKHTGGPHHCRADGLLSSKFFVLEVRLWVAGSCRQMLGSERNSCSITELPTKCMFLSGGREKRVDGLVEPTWLQKDGGTLASQWTWLWTRHVLNLNNVHDEKDVLVAIQILLNR